MEKRKNCGKTGRGAIGHYRALSKNTKNAKIVEKRKNAKIAKNGPGHYGALWGAIKKYEKRKNCGKRHYGALSQHKNNAKNAKNEKTHIFAKMLFFSFFEKQRNDKRANKNSVVCVSAKLKKATFRWVWDFP